MRGVLKADIKDSAGRHPSPGGKALTKTKSQSQFALRHNSSEPKHQKSTGKLPAGMPHCGICDRR